MRDYVKTFINADADKKKDMMNTVVRSKHVKRADEIEKAIWYERT